MWLPSGLASGDFFFATEVRTIFAALLTATTGGDGTNVGGILILRICASPDWPRLGTHDRLERCGTSATASLIGQPGDQIMAATVDQNHHETLNDSFPASDPASSNQVDKKPVRPEDRQPAEIDHEKVAELSEEVRSKLIDVNVGSSE
jgi:hypothetical protein